MNFLNITLYDYIVCKQHKTPNMFLNGSFNLVKYLNGLKDVVIVVTEKKFSPL